MKVDITSEGTCWEPLAFSDAGFQNAGEGHMTKEKLCKMYMDFTYMYKYMHSFLEPQNDSAICSLESTIKNNETLYYINW